MQTDKNKQTDKKKARQEHKTFWTGSTTTLSIVVTAPDYHYYNPYFIMEKP